MKIENIVNMANFGGSTPLMRVIPVQKTHWIEEAVQEKKAVGYITCRYKYAEKL